VNPIWLPAVGALLVLAFDLSGATRSRVAEDARSTALAGVRLGTLAIFVMASVAVVLALDGRRFEDSLLPLDAHALFGVGHVVVFAGLILALSLTHFGMARSRPAEPLALLLFAWSGSLVAMASSHLLLLMLALELAWLPVIALVALDPRRLSSSESSLKAFFAHAFASLVFAHGVAFVYAATGELTFAAFADPAASLASQVGFALILVGLIARAAVAPFHPWSPDVQEGAPGFVATQVTTVGQATVFLVLLRMLHAVPEPLLTGAGSTEARLPALLTTLGVLALVWGHGMALVQTGLRRLVGWLSVGQTGFLTLALVEAQRDGAAALLIGLVAASAATTGVMATLSSLSHHERACERVGDLAGMARESPVRAGLLALFLLSLGGLPGTIGFFARFRVLAALEHGGHRLALLFGLLATALAMIAVGRPLLAMLGETERNRSGSRALSNEVFVLAFCGGVVLYFGVMPIVGETNMSGQLVVWIDRAVASLRP
jgi:NADH-quinone oxidoreductase subunit N